MRISGGIATAAVMMAGVAVAQPAYARQTVNVPCSTAVLLTAISAANSFGSGTLRLASNCNYILTAPSGTGRGPDGLLITGNLRIIGGVSTHITRSIGAPAFRIIEVVAGASLLLRNTFVSGGLTDATVPANDTGGGILSSRGTVTLDHVTLTGNTADNGAGFSNDSGKFALVNTRVENNATRASGGGGGGGYNDGTLTTENSIIRLNQASTDGGGIYNGQGGRTTATSTTIAQNAAGGTGGGVFNASDGQLVLVNTLVQGNSATSGGGLQNAGVPSRVTLNNSLIRLNTPNNCAPPGSLAGCVS